MNRLEVIDANSKKMLDSSKEIRKFISSLVDENSFVETDVFMAGANYIDGVEALGEGVVTGYAYITGNPVCIIAQNHEVLKGSMSVCHSTHNSKTRYLISSRNSHSPYQIRKPRAGNSYSCT